MNLISMVLYAEMKCFNYFNINKIEEDNAEDEIAQKYRRLVEIRNDIIHNSMPEELVSDKYETEVMKIYHKIKCREFVCKVDKVAYLGGVTILAEFWGEYYAKIDFEKYMYKFPELQKLRDEDLFKEVLPQGYHVFFGKSQEVDISSDFIWHFGENVTGKINPEEFEWIRM